METMLKKVIKMRRHGQNRKKGVLIGVKEGDTVTIGWSLERWSDMEKIGFDQKLAESIAMGRIAQKSKMPIPLTLRKEIDLFVDRCSRYFKTDAIVVI